jgi:outer membrane protein assembly complex protein YaeT
MPDAIRTAWPLPCVTGAILVVVLAAGAARGLTVEELEEGIELRVEDVTISGNEAYWARTLTPKLSTRERAWYTPWRPRPDFDPYAFQSDLGRLRRFYESEGYYDVRISHDLVVHEAERHVSIEIRIEENERVETASIDVGVRGEPSPDPGLPESLPIAPGDPFTEETYQAGESRLKEWFLEHSFAQVETEREADVDVEATRAEIRYVVTPGAPSFFGETTISGTEDVDPELVRREIEWKPGGVFSLDEIRTTREQLLDLELFGAVRIGWEPSAADRAVQDMKVAVEEKPPREIRIGVGYGTEDQARGQFRWSHYNWLGGGRQLSAALQISTINRFLNTTFVQPHFLTRRTKGVLEFEQSQAEEDTYTLFGTKFLPRLEHRFTRHLSASIGLRALFAVVGDVDESILAVLGDVDRDGLLFGPRAGVVWNTTEDPFDPRAGQVISIFADQGVGALGGDFRFYKLSGEAKQYVEVGGETVLAGRIGIGVGDTLGGAEDFPIFDRYYAGGETSVRGYGRRRLGPKSASDDPLGGLSLIEGSVELRRSIYGPVGGVIFVDFGQVSLDAYDLRADDLDFSAGPGVSIETPAGPLSLFVGFPFEPPSGDASWQLHFSIGQFF